MESSRPEMDDSPIDLMWLTDFSMEDIVMAQPLSCFQDPQDNLLGFATPRSPLATDAASVGIPHIPCPPVSSSLCMSTHHSMAMVPQLQEDVDYRTNPHVKPPYSYASLICMAMEASNMPQITLTAIYQWITSNFCYYRHAHPSWQNSISLSSNKCFIKVPREKGEPGKGGYWKLDPQYAQKMKSGAFRSLREPPALTRPVLPNSHRQEALRATGPAAAIGSSSKVLSTNPELQQLLRDYKEVTGDRDWSTLGGQARQKRKQPSPSCMAKVSRLSSSDLLTVEEETQLGFVEDVLDTELSGDFSTPGDLQLLPAVSPTPEGEDWMGQGHPIDLLQEQVQGLPECRQNSLDFEETFEASSFLQHLCDEEPSVV